MAYKGLSLVSNMVSLIKDTECIFGPRYKHAPLKIGLRVVIYFFIHRPPRNSVCTHRPHAVVMIPSRHPQ